MLDKRFLWSPVRERNRSSVRACKSFFEMGHGPMLEAKFLARRTHARRSTCHLIRATKKMDSEPQRTRRRGEEGGGGGATTSFVALEEGRIAWHLTRSKKPITRTRSYLVKLNNPGLSCLLFLGALMDVAMYLASSACSSLAACRLRSVAAGGELRKDRRQASNVWWVVSGACSAMGCKSIPAPTVTASEQQSVPWKNYFSVEKKKKWNSRHEIGNKCMQTSAPRWLSSHWL